MNFGVYILRRLMALIPTLLGISIISFILINAAPGGPVEQALSRIKMADGAGSGMGGGGGGARGQNDSAVTQEVIDALKKQYGYDKPLHIRYGIWLKRLVTLDFGDSFIYHRPTWDLVTSKFPVSLLFGLSSFILAYLICIPLGVIKAVHNGSKFDVISSVIVFFAYSIPSFILAILLIVFLGPGNLNLFPIQGLVSEMHDYMGFWGQLFDRIHHAMLPLFCYTIGSFATLTVLMKNSMLEEVRKDYVRTARAKGLGENKIIFVHVLRNALVPIATGLGGLLGVFFAGALLLETIFNLDGIGLLQFQSVLQRDFNVVMALLMLTSAASLIGNLLSDIIYVLIDPRIDFSGSGS